MLREKKRKSPVKHTVKKHTRNGKSVRAHSRGSGAASLKRRVTVKLSKVQQEIAERINDIVQTIAWKVDKWMPEDRDLQDEYYASDKEGREGIVDEFIDKGFYRYYESADDQEFINTHRNKIVEKVTSKIR